MNVFIQNSAVFIVTFNHLNIKILFLFKLLNKTLEIKSVVLNVHNIIQYEK